MTFVVNIIKQDKNQKKPANIKLLLDTDSPMMARKFIENTGLVLLGLNDYKWDSSSFWPVFVDVAYDKQEMRVIGKSDFSLKDLFMFFLELEMDVVGWNTFVNPKSNEEINQILLECKKEIEEAIKLAQEYMQKSDNSQKIYLESEWLARAKDVIAWSLDKVNTLLVDKWAFVSSKDLRLIKEKVESLKKLRMWTNYEKIRDMLQELFSIVDHIEEDYFASLKDESTVLFDWTVVTQNDLERQVSILEKVRKQQEFGGTVPAKRKDYVIFGRFLVFLSFLKKDLLNLFKNSLSYVDRIFDFLQIWVVMAICILSFFLVFGGTNLENIYYSLFSLWFLWFLAYIFSLFKIKNPLTTIVIFVLMFIFYYISLPILKNTFALF